MTETTQTKLIGWNGETYSGLGEYYELVKASAEDLDLDADETLRLAIYAWNCNALLNNMDLTALKDEEQEAYAGEASSVAEFTQEYLEGFLSADIPDWVVIDWQTTWDSALRFDFFDYDVIDIDGQHRIFFWRAY